MLTYPIRMGYSNYLLSNNRILMGNVESIIEVSYNDDNLRLNDS